MMMMMMISYMMNIQYYDLVKKYENERDESNGGVRYPTVGELID